MVKKKANNVEKKAWIRDQIALITAEELVLSLVPLLIAVNEAGGVAAAISILKAARRK